MSKNRKAANKPKSKKGSTAPQSHPADSSAGRVSTHAGLNLLVFVAGAVLMGLEIAGSRVLAPHFGNSVFIWGSLISVFLTSLAIGYYGGGRLADQYPLLSLLIAISVMVSAWILLLASISNIVCETLLEKGLGEQSGPLIASVILFLPPSVGLGVLSPFAVRIAATSVQSVGKVAGTLYALSTTGSIVGTLITTFVLIPWIGLSAILKVLGAVLLVTSVVTLLINARSKKQVAAFSAAGAVLAAILFGRSQPMPLSAHETLVLDVDTPYHHISVVDNSLSVSREMRFDRFTESAIRMAPPYPTLATYTDYFHLAFLHSPELRQVLFIGAGGGVGPRAFSAHDEQIQIDVVDIDQKVLDIAREYFFLEEKEKIRTVAADGRMFLRTSQEQYDCIILDAFTIGGRIPFHLVTREFLELCDSRMESGGVFVMNINSAVKGELSQIFRSMHSTMDSVFPQTYVFALNRGQRSPSQSTNVILLASKKPQPLEPAEWESLARAFHSDSHVGKIQLLSMVKDLVRNVPVDEQSPVFTDDYSPIETMRF